MRVLVVTNPFGGLAVGQRITDQEAIDVILAGDHAHHVVRADHADGEAPSAPAAKTVVSDETPAPAKATK